MSNRPGLYHCWWVGWRLVGSRRHSEPIITQSEELGLSVRQSEREEV